MRTTRADPPRPGPSRLYNDRTDLFIALAMALVGTVSRIPFRAQSLVAWDSILYSLAVEDFDIRSAQPHPPGVPVFIALARVANVFAHDAPLSLNMVALVATASALFLTYGFVRDASTRRAAIVATLLLAVAPVFFFHGLVALSYVTEVPLAVAIAWMCWRLARNPSLRLAGLLGLLFSLAVGTRQSLAFALGPLVAGTLLWNREPGPREWTRRMLGFGATCLATTLAWFLPVILDTGWEEWLWLTQGISQNVIWVTSVGTAGWDAIVANGERLRTYLGFELPFLAAIGGFVLLGAGRALAAKRPILRPESLRATTGFALWILPAPLFVLLVHPGPWPENDGYILAAVPGIYIAFAIAADRGLDSLLRLASAVRRPAFALAGLALLLAPTPFLAWNATHRATERIAPDDRWADALRAIGEAYPPNSSIIVAGTHWPWAKWYFPDHRVFMYFDSYESDGTRRFGFIESRGHHQEITFYESFRRWPNLTHHPMPAHVSTVVVIDAELGRFIEPGQDVANGTMRDGSPFATFDPDGSRLTLEQYFSR